MATNEHFDARAGQLGVAFGLSAGTAIGMLLNNLPYWIVLGSITGFAIAFAKHANDREKER